MRTSNLKGRPIPPMRQPQGPDPSGSAGFAARRGVLRREVPSYSSKLHIRKQRGVAPVSSPPTALNGRSFAAWGPTTPPSNSEWSLPTAGRTSALPEQYITTFAAAANDEVPFDI
ncbi:hypothetical protein MYCTH_2122648 [Thermothelomyces thermophilus ATCC 42464]|uniref:SUZ-C domain-containing protein n=1 Tax=Thermothelomyces thermophilus (strain ATCC 42464 / BCRC 31852 / DSM 1799) TaxID=573729 RepID=G2Q5E9_THET4|nr:uncharacterized protein MYCTH_2122648 [Thermothelomyces thermophilus ATCC 42464]AEO53780.1 hypothetical protein MYCTH_2122648 [Thermothelomyces thermophilus ATCC 42464]